ncbi:ubiquitin carboxyl-terminal hydrolase [Gregarina niphandrodes]|uniref:Ubiquitin carboxyl-terminal hydrolase n=1 Tax=Gregarina niphandrodes TaxID=110365 RepID=A0A023B1H2_GRENI|nr:ubiquitin carboxyl-terminal hydrolase [Gregarina niphandrodes]EZG47880.1 ubiquitin carboxyl-terminal hydrolase [Gregarina niphandrodes]|eukprot:XP_011132141.1 ubiquitin carboxyl-terminal hydrolase [Gregarina niphandrodes]
MGASAESNGRNSEQINSWYTIEAGCSESMTGGARSPEVRNSSNMSSSYEFDYFTGASHKFDGATHKSDSASHEYSSARPTSAQSERRERMDYRVLNEQEWKDWLEIRSRFQYDTLLDMYDLGSGGLGSTGLGSSGLGAVARTGSNSSEIETNPLEVEVMVLNNSKAEDSLEGGQVELVVSEKEMDALVENKCVLLPTFVTTDCDSEQYVLRTRPRWRGFRRLLLSRRTSVRKLIGSFWDSRRFIPTLLVSGKYYSLAMCAKQGKAGALDSGGVESMDVEEPADVEIGDLAGQVRFLLVDLKSNKVEMVLVPERASRSPEKERAAALCESGLSERILASGGVCGLSNLGNTCYMNSAIQCLSHCVPLTLWYLNERYKSCINQDNPLGTGGRLASAYASTLRKLWTVGARRCEPSALKKVVGAYCPMFRGYDQQDAQEFIAYLLDGLHEDGNVVTSKPYVEKPEIVVTQDGQVNVNGYGKERVARSLAPAGSLATAGSLAAAEDVVEDLLGECAWEGHVLRNKSHVVDLFHGLLKSRLHCDVCRTTLVTYDPMMYASLTIPRFRTCVFAVALFMPRYVKAIAFYLAVDYREEVIMTAGSVADQLTIIVEKEEHQIKSKILEYFNPPVDAPAPTADSPGSSLPSSGPVSRTRKNVPEFRHCQAVVNAVFIKTPTSVQRAFSSDSQDNKRKKLRSPHDDSGPRYTSKIHVVPALCNPDGLSANADYNRLLITITPAYEPPPAGELWTHAATTTGLPTASSSSSSAAASPPLPPLNGGLSNGGQPSTGSSSFYNGTLIPTERSSLGPKRRPSYPLLLSFCLPYPTTLILGQTSMTFQYYAPLQDNTDVGALVANIVVPQLMEDYSKSVCRLCIPREGNARSKLRARVEKLLAKSEYVISAVTRTRARKQGRGSRSTSVKRRSSYGSAHNASGGEVSQSDEAVDKPVRFYANQYSRQPSDGTPPDQSMEAEPLLGQQWIDQFRLSDSSLNHLCFTVPDFDLANLGFGATHNPPILSGCDMTRVANEYQLFEVVRNDLPDIPQDIAETCSWLKKHIAPSPRPGPPVYQWKYTLKEER